MVFYAGDSTDGTIDIIAEMADEHPLGDKIKLVRGKEPKDLKGDYERLSNEAMWAVDADLAIFLHPDMFPYLVTQSWGLPDDVIAASVNIRSFAGDSGKLYRVKGRGEIWKNIYRLRNPNLGAHYFGHYGAANEDTYFSEITGNDHEHYGAALDLYPYPVFKTDIVIDHYSDVRSYERRLDRMVKCLLNQGHPQDKVMELAKSHPRVSLKNGQGFEFIKVKTPKWLEVK
jgi:hypothetical protein